MIKCGSLFSQVLSLVDRNDFSRAVRQWDAEKGAKGFRCWDQLVAMSAPFILSSVFRLLVIPA